MEITKVKTTNIKRLGVPVVSTTVYFDTPVGAKNKSEGLRLVIEENQVKGNSFKLVKGLFGRYEQNVKFEEYSNEEAQAAYSIYFKYMDQQGKI